MGRCPSRSRAEAPLEVVVERIARRPRGASRSIDAAGELVGVVSARRRRGEALGTTRGRPSAGALAHAPRELHADDVLEDAVRALSLSDDPAVPVFAAAAARRRLGHPPRHPARLPRRARAADARAASRQSADA